MTLILRELRASMKVGAVQPGGHETELVETAERGQIRAGEGSVRHVEVFQMVSVRTSILRRPRPLSSHRRADTTTNLLYTLIWDEP